MRVLIIVELVFVGGLGCVVLLCGWCLRFRRFVGLCLLAVGFFVGLWVA